MQRLKNYEKETFINYSAAENYATVYSAYLPDIKKLDKIVSMRKEAECIGSDDCGKSYKIPKSWVRIKPNKQYSEETKERLKNIMLQNRAKNSG